MFPGTYDAHFGRCWPYQPALPEIFSEAGDYILAVAVSCDDVPTETALLKFTWTRDWQTSKLALVPESSKEYARQESEHRHPEQIEGTDQLPPLEGVDDERRHEQMIWWTKLIAVLTALGVLIAIFALCRPSSPPSPSPPSTLNTPTAQQLSSPAAPSVFPSPSPRPAETKNPMPIASATPAESGLMEMTIQQFTRRYLKLDGRYAEQEAFLKKADRKRVRWKVSFLFPTSHNHEVVLQFDVPAESPHEKPLFGSPVRWADFPLSFRDRLYSLRRGDLVEISGVLKFLENTLVIQGDDFDLVTTPTLTPTPRTKNSRQWK